MNFAGDFDKILDITPAPGGTYGWLRLNPGCCFPGCTYRRYLDAHHIEHWAEGGATKLSNLVNLCRTHHRLVHEGGIGIEARTGGGWRFLRPDGREFEILYRQPPPAHEWMALRKTHAAQGISIDSDTAATRWRGERMDYELGVWTLCRQAERAKKTRDGDGRDVSAETSYSAKAFGHEPWDASKQACEDGVWWASNR